MIHEAKMALPTNHNAPGPFCSSCGCPHTAFTAISAHRQCHIKLRPKGRGGGGGIVDNLNGMYTALHIHIAFALQSPQVNTMDKCKTVRQRVGRVYTCRQHHEYSLSAQLLKPISSFLKETGV